MSIDKLFHVAIDLFHLRFLDFVSTVLNKDLVNAQGLVSSPPVKEKKKVCHSTHRNHIDGIFIFFNW